VESEAEHSPPSTTQIKNERTYTYAPVCLHGVQNSGGNCLHIKGYYTNPRTDKVQIDGV